MFSGIVEATASILRFEPIGDIYSLNIVRPTEFEDLRLGDSIAVNGVCLTVEKLEPKNIQFAVGPETLNISQWKSSFQIGVKCNLERSLRLGDRIHGHLVSGHVDSLGEVTDVQDVQGARFLKIKLLPQLAPYVWKKGSITVQGVSLTINALSSDPSPLVEVCLIPETLKRTNLKDLTKGQKVCIEPDWMARGLLRLKELNFELNT